MAAYIQADFYRLLRRVPRILLIILSNLILVGMLVYRYFTNWNAYQLCDAAAFYLKYLGPGILGMAELSAVYGDDFRAKTMQVAIGIGVSRRGVVLAKGVELALAAAADLLVGLLLTFAAGGLLGAGLVAEQYGDLAVYLAIGLLQLICYGALAAIPMFFTQSTGLGMLVYLACVLPLIPWWISSAVTLGPLAPYRLDNYLFYNLTEQLGAYLLTRTFHPGLAVGVLAHLALFYAAAVLLFRKRELEF